MPEASFNKELNLPGGTGTFVKLKGKGDKLKFRIANTPHYETIHWVGDKPELCGKFNSDEKGSSCEHCEAYDRAVEDGDEKKSKAIKAQTNFYYPILNLDTGKPAIFQFSAKSIHYTIKGYADEDVDVFNCDWSVERTEEQGNYYKVLRLGDKKLSPELQEQYELAKKLKIKSKESQSITAKSEKTSDDIPF